MNRSMMRFRVAALILLASSTAAWLWVENRRLKSEEFTPNVPAVVITLHSHPCDVQIVMNDLNQVDALISKSMARAIKVPEDVSFKLIGSIQIRGKKPPITLFWPIGAFDAGEGIHKTDLSGLEKVMRASLKRSGESF